MKEIKLAALFLQYFRKHGDGISTKFAGAVGHCKPGFQHVHVWHDCSYGPQNKHSCHCGILRLWKGKRAPNVPSVVTPKNSSHKGYSPRIETWRVQKEESSYFRNLFK